VTRGPGVKDERNGTIPIDGNVVVGGSGKSLLLFTVVFKRRGGVIS